MKFIKRTILIAISFFAIQSSFAQTNNTDSITVNGNCGMCKKTIEKSAIAAGATTANWDKKTKVLVVSYDPSKSNTPAIEKAIAGAGYDTQNMKADDTAYKNLEGCCQYDRKELSAQKKSN